MRAATTLLSVWLVVAHFVPGLAAAQPAGTQGEVIVLEVADDPEAAQHERRFLTELRLSLDGLAVTAVAPSAGFSQRPLAEQIAQVRALVAGRRAVAVSWIGRLDTDLLLLHMVVLSTHRALVRLLEAPLSADVEARLALAARELLGTAYLLAPGDARRPAALDRAVASVRAQVAEPRARAAPRRPWALSLRAHLEAALSASSGPSSLRGGELSLQRHVAGPWWAHAGLGAALGPSGAVDRGRVEGYELWPSAGLGVFWPAPAAQLGLTLDAQLRLSRLAFRVGEAPRSAVLKQRIRVQAVALLHWQPGTEVGVLLQLSLGLQSHRDRYVRSSDGEPIVERPELDWSLQAGPSLSL